MKKRYNNINAIGNNQHGAVLIVVLLFLVLITLAGVMSVKNSNTDLQVATSDQINTVLLQSADNVNIKFEGVANASQNSEGYKTLMVDKTGVFSHYVNDLSSLTYDDTISFCFKSRGGTNFTVTDATIQRRTGILKTGTDGYCDVTNPDHYTSSRGTTMTQVMVNRVEGKEAYPSAFSAMTIGSDTETVGVQKTKFDIHSTSLLPALGSANSDDVKDCIAKVAILREAPNEDGETIKVIDKKAMLNCMSQEDIIAKQVVERAEVRKKLVTEYCTLYGGTKGDSSSALCRTAGS